MKKPNFSWKRVADSFSTRSFRAGGYTVAAAAIVLAIAVMVNVFAAALPALPALVMDAFKITIRHFFRPPKKE